MDFGKEQLPETGSPDPQTLTWKAITTAKPVANLPSHSLPGRAVRLAVSSKINKR